MPHRNLIKSFAHAVRGFYYAVRGERNMKIHLVIATGVLCASFMLHLSITERLIILLCIALVLVTEMINTAFEYMVDLFHGPKINPVVKMLKDVASSAVLLASIFSAIIGTCIFWGKLFK